MKSNFSVDYLHKSTDSSDPKTPGEPLLKKLRNIIFQREWPSVIAVPFFSLVYLALFILALFVAYLVVFAVIVFQFWIRAAFT